MSADDEDRPPEGCAEEERQRAFLRRYLRGLEAALGRQRLALPGDEGGPPTAPGRDEAGADEQWEDRTR